MTTENLALFKAIGAKMEFLNQRQKVISGNVSNADTPNYRPQDIQDEDFSAILKDVIKSESPVAPVRLDTTRGNHIPANGEVDLGDTRKQKHTYEVAPDGNSVIMEEQLIKAGRTMMDYNLMANLYQKQTGMIKTALGRGQ